MDIRIRSNPNRGSGPWNPNLIFYPDRILGLHTALLHPHLRFFIDYKFQGDQYIPAIPYLNPHSIEVVQGPDFGRSESPRAFTFTPRLPTVYIRYYTCALLKRVRVEGMIVSFQLLGDSPYSWFLPYRPHPEIRSIVDLRSTYPSTTQARIENSFWYSGQTVDTQNRIMGYIEMWVNTDDQREHLVAKLIEEGWRFQEDRLQVLVKEPSS